MKELLLYMAKNLVDNPDSVSVTEIEGETTVLELRVAPEDMGKLIGRQGRIAKEIPEKEHSFSGIFFTLRKRPINWIICRIVSELVEIRMAYHIMVESCLNCGKVVPWYDENRADDLRIGRTCPI